MSDTTLSNRETALALAAAGFSVFPCHAGGEKAKSPMPFIKWREASTTNERQIAQWWQKWPAAAIGLDLAKSGLIVIDADRHDESADGVEAFGALMGAHEFDPDSAPLVATPSQGNHHYFRQRPGETLGSSAGALGRKSDGKTPSGIDVKGHGGYVIAPGTVMGEFALKDGRIIPAGAVYELWGEMSEAPVIPGWLHAMITTPLEPVRDTSLQKAQTSHEQAEIDEIAELLGYINPDSGYQDWLAALMAVHAATGGSSTGLAVADDWSARGSKYKGTKELAAKWKSFKGQGVNLATLAALARENGADLSAIAVKHRGHEHDYDRVEAAEVARRLIEHHDGTLADAETGEVIDEGHGVSVGGDWSNPGGLIGDIADWIVETAPLPNRKLALAAAIAFVSLVCSRHRETPGFAGGLQLFTICTGQTGIGKDWPMKAIDRLAIETGLQALIKSGKLTTSLAVEREIEQCATHLIVADEVGRRIFGKAGHKRASTYESSMTDLFLELWSCNPVSVFRTTSRAQSSAATIEGPAISLFGVSTHRDFYTSIGRASVDNGMVNRLLIIEADKRAKLRSIDGAAAKHPPRHIIDAVAALKPPEPSAGTGSLIMGIQAYMSSSGVTPRPVPWGQEAAQQRWEAFREDMLTLSDRNEETAPFVSRAAEMVLRLACIHALSRFGPEAAVMLDSIEWAIAVVNESCRNAIEGVDEFIVSSDFQDHVKRVERIIRAKGTVPMSLIARKMGGSIDNQTLGKVLSHLELAGKVSGKDSPRGKSYTWSDG